ncbi:hypothetical protein Ancab_036702 [Ancistrocladus abbreviatus]
MDTEIKSWKMESNSAFHHAKTYAKSGDGDMFGGKGLRDEWETPISSLKREKGRKKKGKCASKSYPADFSED